MQYQLVVKPVYAYALRACSDSLRTGNTRKRSLEMLTGGSQIARSIKRHCVYARRLSRREVVSAGKFRLGFVRLLAVGQSLADIAILQEYQRTSLRLGPDGLKAFVVPHHLIRGYLQGERFTPTAQAYQCVNLR